MATSTYLTITNSAIMEAGTDLAFFASNGSDFASPPTMMHTRFKRWVASAWRDIQQSAPDWHFSVEQATVRLHPRIAFDASASTGVTTYFPNGVDYDIRPISSSDVLQTVYVEDGLVRQGVLNSSSTMDCQGYVDLRGNEADAIDFGLHVGSTELAYSDGMGIVVQLVVSGWGSYDFGEATENSNGRPPVRDGVKQINQSTFRLAEYGTTSAEGAGTGKEKALAFIPWESFMDYGFDVGSNSPGEPVYVTQDYEGRWRFYPALNKDYEIIFNYERGVQLLTDYDDVPESIPEEFVDLIVWRALQYFGLYDEQPSIANTTLTGRADKMAKMLQQRLERQTREKVHFKPKRLW